MYFCMHRPSVTVSEHYFRVTITILIRNRLYLGNEMMIDVAAKTHAPLIRDL